MREIKRHLDHYLVLASILTVGALTMAYFSGGFWINLALLSTTTVFYVMWGILHHYLIGDLHLRVVWEYLLMGILVMMIYAGANWQR